MEGGIWNEVKKDIEGGMNGMYRIKNDDRVLVKNSVKKLIYGRIILSF